MADPVTMTLIASTAMSAVGAIQQGNAQAAQYKAQAQANEYNARIQRMQAEAAAQQASAREDLQRRGARQVIGQQLAATAESGVLLNGTASDLFRQSLVNAEQDALNIRYEGELNRVGLLNQANLSDYEAKAARKAASAARTAGYLSAAGTIAGGAYSYSKLPGATAAPSVAGSGLRMGGGTGLRMGGGTGLRY